MCAYKPYENVAYGEFDHDYQSVFIASDVKDVMLIANVISCRKINLYVRQISPLCPFGGVIPSLKGRLSISMSFRTIEFHQLSM